MGAYMGGFVVSEHESKGAMLYRWELAPPDALLMDASIAEAAGWLTPGKNDGQWHCRCTQVHTPYILLVLGPVLISLYQT